MRRAAGTGRRTSAPPRLSEGGPHGAPVSSSSQLAPGAKELSTPPVVGDRGDSQASKQSGHPCPGNPGSQVLTTPRPLVSTTLRLQVLTTPRQSRGRAVGRRRAVGRGRAVGRRRAVGRGRAVGRTPRVEKRVLSHGGFWSIGRLGRRGEWGG